MYRIFYRAALNDIQADEAAYTAAVDDWYLNGDGRSTADGGRGYRFPHCPHGMSLWTDYDNICGPCEDGYTAVQRAQGVARERFLRFLNTWNWITSAPPDVDHEIVKAVTAQALQMCPQYRDRNDWASPLTLR